MITLISEKLKALSIPDLLVFNNQLKVENADDWKLRRKEILDMLCSQMYGVMPSAPEKVEAEVIERDENAFAGKATQSKISISFDTENGVFAFPVHLIIPKGVSKPPLILHIAFSSDIPDKYFPAEEVIDNGFSVASFNYNDITLDKDDDFSSGLAGMYNRTRATWGKIAMWAWSASRVMDYLQTVEEIDREKIAVMGHSRLGKTALLAGALDERFKFVISNNSGSGGAAITRENHYENVKQLCARFGYWFCENYKQYSDNDEKMPFDQHFLLAAVAPRFLYVASAKEDKYADPLLEYLSCASADLVFRLLGTKGFIHPDRLPIVGDVFDEGQIGYHLRAHGHYLSRFDWVKFMQFTSSKSNW